MLAKQSESNRVYTVITKLQDVGLRKDEQNRSRTKLNADTVLSELI